MRWRPLKWLASVLVFLMMGTYGPQSHAHKLAPSLWQIDEIQAGVYQVAWRTPVYADVSPVPVFPEICRDEGSGAALAGTAIERRWVTRCEGGLGGKTVAVKSLEASRTVVMLRFQPLDGELQQRILTPDAASYTVPDSHAGGSVFSEYGRLGVKHILVGADHLFFVTALLLLAGSWQMLLRAVTAFTLGHSVTLALVSLQLIPHWPAFVEFLIAATILILALELSKPSTGSGQHYIRRYQWLAAGVFGLVHGLGFAGVLSDIGIPSGDVVSALLAFNVGIEVGQLLFVGVMAGLFYAVRRWSARSYAWTSSVVVSVMGGFSVYWCLDRGAEILRQFL